MSESVTERIHSFLHSKEVEFRSLSHPPTLTSEESAKARGEDIRNGAKALLLKIDGSFRLFVLSAAMKLDSKAVKKFFGKECRFATKEELLQLTGLVPGSVPPFGEPILPFELFIDELIWQLEKVAFNAGSLTDSIIMSAKDYVRIAGGNRIRFASEA